MACKNIVHVRLDLGQCFSFLNKILFVYLEFEIVITAKITSILDTM